MSELTISSAPDMEPSKDARAPYSQVFRRIFECGHPDEFIEVRLLDDGEQVHNLITFEVLQEDNRVENRPVYIEARCLNCAKAAKEEEDKNPNVRPKRTLGAYQAGTLSTYIRKADMTSLAGFDAVLERYRCSGDRDIGVKLHRRVSEEEHRAHRLEIQAEAVESPGRWLAVPARRVWNAPGQTTNELEQAIHQRDVSHSSEHEANFRKGNEISGQSSEPEKNTDEGTEDMIIMRAGNDVVQDLSHLPLAHTPKSNDESFRLAAWNVSTLSGSKLETRTKISEVADMTTNDSDSALLKHETEARRPQTADSSNSPGSASIVEHLIDQYASPFDDSSDPPLVDLKYTHPRPPPAVPKRGPMHFMKQRSSTSTRTSTKSEPASRNFRKLRLDVQQSDISIKKTEPDSDSPQWACQTSLAIEAGRISMDNVSLQSRESTSLYHISEAVRSPIKTLSTGHRKVQGARTRGRRNTYSSPSIEYSSALSTSGRHSEGAIQAAQREGAVLKKGRLEGMERALRKEPSRRDSAQVASLMDLNKSLPALPSQEIGKGGKE